MKIDLHIHSIYSSDGTLEIKEILKIARKIGLDAIAITDHNEIKGALKAKKMNIIPVVRGIEISSKEGHILAYGVDCKIPRDLSVEETIERIRDCSGIAVAAHPYRYWSGLGEENCRKYNFDAIEIFNGRCRRRSNSKARELCNSLHQSYTAGSDAHFSDEIGKAGVIAENAEEDEIIQEILKKRVKVWGEPRNFFETIRYVRRAVSGWIIRGFRRI